MLAESREAVVAGRVQVIFELRELAMRMAVQVSDATTPTAFPRLTRAMALDALLGMVFTVPPRVGQWTTDANTMPGTCTSMPNTAEPSTLAGISVRAIR